MEGAARLSLEVPVIETERLRLRRHRLDDFAASAGDVGRSHRNAIHRRQAIYARRSVGPLAALRWTLGAGWASDIGRWK